MRVLGCACVSQFPAPDALLFDAGDLVDAGDGFGIQPAVGGGLKRQLFTAARRWLMVEGALPLDWSTVRWPGRRRGISLLHEGTKKTGGGSAR